MTIEMINNIELMQDRHNRWAAWNDGTETDLTLRPFRKDDADYEKIVPIANANYPDSPMTVNEFRYQDDSWEEKHLLERIVAEQNDRVIGFATYGDPWWSLENGKFYFGINVHPDWHDTSAAASLYKAVLEALQSYGPKQMVTEFGEDQAYLVELLESEGFDMVMRQPISDLDVQQFDVQRFNANAERVRDAGIHIDCVRTVAVDDGNWKRKFWDLEWDIFQDVPSPEPLTRRPFERWEERILGSPNFLPDGVFIARDGDRFVGMSALWRSEADPKKLYTGLTGVIRSHRRKGIATAMKVRGIMFAQEKGVEIIETDNEENNPMLDLNKQLGFKEKPALVFYSKELEVKEPIKEIEKIPL